MTGDDELVSEADCVELERYSYVPFDDYEARADVKRLVATVRELRAVLKSVEWDAEDWRSRAICPICENRQREGHTADCRLARAIGADRG